MVTNFPLNGQTEFHPFMYQSDKYILFFPALFIKSGQQHNEDKGDIACLIDSYG